MSNDVSDLHKKTLSNQEIRERLAFLAQEVSEWESNMQEKQQVLDQEEEFLAVSQQELAQEQQRLAEEIENLNKQYKKLESQQRQIEMERENSRRAAETEKKRLDQERNLFDMKWKIMEEEIAKLADERKQFDLEKEFHQRVNSYNSEERVGSEFDLFFRGIDNELALRKRYRDLLKIFHPDNLYGDNEIVQELNRQFDELQKQFCG